MCTYICKCGGDTFTWTYICVSTHIYKHVHTYSCTYTPCVLLHLCPFLRTDTRYVSTKDTTSTQKISTYTYIYKYINAYTYKYVHIHIDIFTYTHVHISSASYCASLHSCAQIPGTIPQEAPQNVYIYIHLCMYIHVHTYI